MREVQRVGDSKGEREPAIAGPAFLIGALAAAFLLYGPFQVAERLVAWLVP